MAPRLVRLRALTRADEDEFTSLMRRSRGLHRPWTSPPTTKAAFEQLIARQRRGDFEAFLVCGADDGAIRGYFAISEIVRGAFKSAYVGYSVGAGYEGRGYMTEGLRLVQRRAFTGMRLHRLEANVQPGNDRSIALVARCGFRHEGFSPRYLKIGGRWRDHERWAITVEDWRASRP
jgi:ribosomal-protein-alanine N-acetyltransferase